MSYLYLIGAVLFEVTGTLLLPVSNNFTKVIPSIVLTLCYLMAFYLMTFALKTIPIAIVYATWAGMGIFLIAIFSYFIYGQTLQWQSVIGLFFIVIGVVLVNTFSNSHMTE